MPDSRVESRVALLNAVDAGLFEKLTCPDCGLDAVSAWFTHPAEGEYRTWLVCSNCPFEVRAHNTALPVSFNIERINEQLQKRDESIVAARRL